MSGKPGWKPIVIKETGGIWPDGWIKGMITGVERVI